MVKEKLIVNQSVTKNRKIFEKPSNDIILSLQSSINEKSKIKYLDQKLPISEISQKN
jgi:hypothetical protein